MKVFKDYEIIGHMHRAEKRSKVVGIMGLSKIFEQENNLTLAVV